MSVETENKTLTGYPSIDKPWLKYYSDEAINAPLPECTAFTYIYERNKNNLDKTAMNYFGEKITYGQMFSRTEDIAKAFAQVKIVSGDIVSLCMLTMPETVYTFYALNWLGAVANIIEPRVNAARIRDRITATGSRILVMTDVFYEKLKDVLNDTCLELIVVVPLSNSMPPLKRAAFLLTKGQKIPAIPYGKLFIRWTDFVRTGRDFSGEAEAAYSPHTVAAIVYTGGTTGIPKGAMLPNETFTVMGRNNVHCNLGLYAGKSFLDIMPPFIAYGLVFGLFIPFCFGLENILVPMFTSTMFPSLMVKHKPDHTVGVPSFFEELAKSKQAKHIIINYFNRLSWSPVGFFKLVFNRTILLLYVCQICQKASMCFMR